MKNTQTYVARPTGRRVGLVRRNELEALIRHAQDRLTAQEIEVLKFRLGLVDGYTRTLKKTGARHGMTAADVKRLEERLLGKKLRTLSDAELHACLRGIFEGPQWAQKILAECYEEDL